MGKVKFNYPVSTGSFLQATTIERNQEKIDYSLAHSTNTNNDNNQVFDFETIATFNVIGLPPPTPIICNLSGDSKTDSSTLFFSVWLEGISSYNRYSTFDDQPSIHMT